MNKQEKQAYSLAISDFTKLLDDLQYDSNDLLEYKKRIKQKLLKMGKDKNGAGKK